MYFSLTNVPLFFQRVMHRDFQELLQQYPENLGNYMDDWWIVTDDTEEGIQLHRQIVHAFLDQMEQKSYFLKASKTQFKRPQIELLGWLVSKEGIKIDRSKVSGIADWPRELRSVKEVWETLGVLGYQWAFIKDFTKIVRPLHNLTKKDMTFKWTEECTAALDELIRAVTSELVLYQPDFTKQFELEIDASLFAVGAVLFQRDEEGQRHHVSYYLALLNEAKRNYDVWDREFLGMIHGLKHNRHLLIGSPHKVLVFTDHENLAHYRYPQKINRRVAWYLHILVDFDLELCHIPGTTNKVDALSRRPDHDKRTKDNEAIIALPDSLFAWALRISKLDKDIRTLQKRNHEVFTQWKRSYQCQEINRILYKDRALVVTTKGTAWRDLLKRCHDDIMAGHPGVWKTLQGLRKDYWWPNMRLYI